MIAESGERRAIILLIEALLAGVEPGLGPDVVLVNPLTGLVPLRPLLVAIGLAGSFPGLPFLLPLVPDARSGNRPSSVSTGFVPSSR